MRDRLFVQLFLAAIICTVPPATGFLWDKEVEIIRSEWSPVVVVVRHVEYIGVIDNGTLDCSVPGFTKYRWTIINKASKENYAESYIMGSGDNEIPESQAQIQIGNGGFPLVNDLMVVSCEAMVGLNPRMQIIWAITRLHSPLGYPTDPRVCDFSGKNFDTNCTWYQWTYKTDCYYDKGLEYTGSVNYANNHKKCKYWHMATGRNGDSHLLARYMGIYFKGGHDYCRNINVNPSCYLKKRKAESCKDNILTQPWCYSDDNPTEKPLTVHYCNVRQCSSCIYGNGDGTFKLYPKRKFPVYLGRGIQTVKGDQYNCLQGVGWEDNICRTNLAIKTPAMSKPHVVTKTTPHCHIAKIPDADSSKYKKVPDEGVELAKCKFRQCTIRQVWFLFFNTYGQPFVLESNFKGVKLDLVEGRKEERIKFAAFGIHMTDGFKIGANDYSVSNSLGSFELNVRRPPDKLSELVIKNIKKQYKGKYFIEYKFQEADPTVDHELYKVNFEIDVKEPTVFSLNPPVLRVCLNGDGKINAKINGFFPILEDSIKWKYGTSRGAIKHDILPQNTRFELSADAKSLVIKKVTEESWVSVEGRSYSGLTLAAAQIALKEQAFLKAVSPLIQYVLPGDDVTLIIEHDQLQPVTWVFDAMVIASLPDDPNMAFRRVVRGDKLVTSLVITDVRDHHYGDYHVETTLDGCKSVVKLGIKHSSENPDIDDLNKSKKKVTVINFNRTGIWCTDELDPYAFFFDIKFDTLSTIGALRNEPLTKSNAAEIQYYSVKYSTNMVTWSRFVFSGNSSRIPYTLLGTKIHWLRVPIRAKYLRVYPERLDSVACMKVRFFGCKGSTLDCDGINRIKDNFTVPIIVGSSSGVVLLIAVAVFFLWKRGKLPTLIKSSTKTERKQKAGKRKRKRKPTSEHEKGKRKRRPRKKTDEGEIKRKKENEVVEDVKKMKKDVTEKPKKKRKRFTSSEESSFELDSEEERAIRRQAKLKAKKKEIEWEEKIRLKRKLAKQKEKENQESEEDVKELSNEDEGEKVRRDGDSEEEIQNKQKRSKDGKRKRNTSSSSSREKRKNSLRSKDDTSLYVRLHDEDSGSESLTTSSSS